MGALDEEEMTEDGGYDPDRSCRNCDICCDDRSGGVFCQKGMVSSAFADRHGAGLSWAKGDGCREGTDTVCSGGGFC